VPALDIRPYVMARRIAARGAAVNCAQIVKQPSFNEASAIARILCGAGYAVVDSQPPAREAERRKTQGRVVRAPRAAGEAARHA
jgi:hypothetical protein